MYVCMYIYIYDGMSYGTNHTVPNTWENRWRGLWALQAQIQDIIAWRVFRWPEGLLGPCGPIKSRGFSITVLHCFAGWLPEIRVPPNHPFIVGIFHEINHPASLGHPHFGKPPYGLALKIGKVVRVVSGPKDGHICRRLSRKSIF